jgi:hypothetical protein
MVNPPALAWIDWVPAVFSVTVNDPVPALRVAGPLMLAFESLLVTVTLELKLVAGFRFESRAVTPMLRDVPALVDPLGIPLRIKEVAVPGFTVT